MDNQRVICIAAVADNGVIGYQNSLPWSLPDDWAVFKERTAGYPFLMGRLSYESPHALLSDVRNVILSRQPNLPMLPNCELATSIDAAWVLLAEEPVVFVLGGSAVFEATLPKATHLYLTHVHAQPVGDAFFPRIDLSAWRVLRREAHPKDAHHAYDFEFVDYERQR
jgi:dihydrofolate reductase